MKKPTLDRMELENDSSMYGAFFESLRRVPWVCCAGCKIAKRPNTVKWRSKNFKQNKRVSRTLKLKTKYLNSCYNTTNIDKYFRA